MILKDLAAKIREKAELEQTWEVERAMLKIAQAIDEVAGEYVKLEKVTETNTGD